MIRLPFKNEDGFAVATAITLMSIMLIVGFATLAAVDTGSERVREQRVRESALNLTEGALYYQGAVLARNWPVVAASKYPGSCTPAASLSVQCPTNASLADTSSSSATYRATDFKADTAWETWVRDDYGTLEGVYRPEKANTALTGTLGTCPAPCTYDFDGDKQLWVQARAKVRDKYRNIVALLKLEQLGEGVPQTAVVAGAMRVTNNGNHGDTSMVDATGSNVIVRCNPEPPGTKNATCTEYESGQVTPTPVSGNPPSLMTPQQIARFRDRAKIDKTWYQTCPDTFPAGQVVFIETCDGKAYQKNGQDDCLGVGAASSPPAGLHVPCVNTIKKPGLVIFNCGGMQAAANWTFVGVMYFANGTEGTCAVRGNNKCESSQYTGNDVLMSNGGFGIWGALVVDGPACVKLGSNGMQVKYDRNVFGAVTSYGTVGLVQNTWRELPPT